jgi:DNA transformation protein
MHSLLTKHAVAVNYDRDDLASGIAATIYKENGHHQTGFPTIAMAVSKDFNGYVQEQLRLLPALTSRRMFGGIGLYSDGLFFALLDDDTLFCKVDDSNRADYVERGARAFMPVADKPLGYYSVPVEILEDIEELTRWAKKSLTVALAAAQRKLKLRAAPSRKAKASRKSGSRATKATRRTVEPRTVSKKPPRTAKKKPRR